MNRRGFLTSLAGFTAGMTLDPERLLWRPGAKVISIPKMHGAAMEKFIAEYLNHQMEIGFAAWRDAPSPMYSPGSSKAARPPFSTVLNYYHAA